VVLILIESVRYSTSEPEITSLESMEVTCDDPGDMFRLQDELHSERLDNVSR